MGGLRLKRQRMNGRGAEPAAIPPPRPPHKANSSSKRHTRRLELLRWLLARSGEACIDRSSWGCSVGLAIWLAISRELSKSCVPPRSLSKPPLAMPWDV